MRIYIGGLGSNVQADDLKNTFTSPYLGTVESVEIIRSKGRSFGYLDFIPASDKGLAKLFSTYNGCMWKGGKLKLEKAREDYLIRLNREWAEDAELAIKLSRQNTDATDADESLPIFQKPKKEDLEKMQLNIFFPKLRKIKPLPLKGTGKHKYSFQRVEVPPLPVHFCDCEEHSVLSEPVKKTFTDRNETETCGVNEDELNMMKSILNKLLGEEDRPTNVVSNENEFTEEINRNVSSADNLQVDVSEEDQVSDEDNLVINIVGRPSNRVASFENLGKKATARNQDSLLREPKSHEMRGIKKTKLLPDKKRKQIENNTTSTVSSKKKAKSLNESIVDQIPLTTKPTNTEIGSVQLSSSQKSAWKDLVRQKGSSGFHISDILTDVNPEVEMLPSSDHLAPPEKDESFSDIELEKDSQDDSQSSKELEKIDHLAEPEEKDSQDEQSSKDEELEKMSDVEPVKQKSAFEDKTARGAAWLQKSSWLQLIADTNKSAFSIGQILPCVTFEKQELPQFDNNNLSSTKSGKQQSFVHEDQKIPAGDVSKPEGRGNKNVFAGPGNLNVDALTKDQGHAGQSSSGIRQTVEEKKDRASVGDFVISETCPFMKSAASMKEWAKTKAALSGSLKKKGGKELVRD